MTDRPRSDSVKADGPPDLTIGRPAQFGCVADLGAFTDVCDDRSSDQSKVTDTPLVDV